MTSDAALNDTVQALATHALPLFGVLLAAVLAMAALAWWLLNRYGVHREASRFTPLAYLAFHGLAGFAFIVMAAAMFAELAEVLGDGEQAGALDLLFSDTIRSTVSPVTLRVFATLTHLGDTFTITVLTTLVVLALMRLKERWLCAGLLLAVVGNALLNHTLKGIFARTRPVHDHGLATADGFSFPSGHSSGTVVLYGMLAYVLLRLLPAATPGWVRMVVVLLAAAVAFSTGCSRVFLQVHFATDVMAGFASGAAWLTVCLLGLEWQRYRCGSRH